MELLQGRPADLTGRLEKEIRTYDLLDSLKISYQRVDHEPAMTMEVCAEIDKVLEYTDSILLRKGLNLTEHEFELMNSIWNKMCGRRMTRKNQSE